MINILSSHSLFAEDFAYEVLSKIIKPTHRVCIIGYSFFSNMTEDGYKKTYGRGCEYDVKMIQMFSRYGIMPEQIDWVYYYDDMNEKSVHEMIKASDILYFPGGAPDLMMMRIIEKNLFHHLKNHQGIMMGSSAGAMIQFENFHISPDQDYHQYSLHQGLGYINDYMVEVHYERRKKQKSSMRKTFRKFKTPILTIPNRGLIIIENKAIKTLGGAILYYGKKGVIRT